MQCDHLSCQEVWNRVVLTCSSCRSVCLSFCRRTTTKRIMNNGHAYWMQQEELNCSSCLIECAWEHVRNCSISMEWLLMLWEDMQRWQKNCGQMTRKTRIGCGIRGGERKLTFDYVLLSINCELVVWCTIIHISIRIINKGTIERELLITVTVMFLLGEREYSWSLK